MRLHLPFDSLFAGTAVGGRTSCGLIVQFSAVCRCRIMYFCKTVAMNRVYELAVQINVARHSPSRKCSNVRCLGHVGVPRDSFDGVRSEKRAFPCPPCDSMRCSDSSELQGPLRCRLRQCLLRPSERRRGNGRKMHNLAIRVGP